MKKLLTATAILAALSLPASANKVYPPKPKPLPPTQSRSSSGNGPWIAGYAIGCPALSLLGWSAYIAHTQHREMTTKEAWMSVVGCFLPIIGPQLVEQNWRPEWR